MAYSITEPVIVDAPSSRSKCKACTHGGGGDPTIKLGSKRVGHPGRAAGVTVQHWCHPACFAKWCLRVDSAPTRRSKCKADGSEIAKGAIRLLIGYQKESTTYKVENVHRTIVPELVSLVGRTNVVIHGLDQLPLAERQQVESAILDCSGANRGAIDDIGSKDNGKEQEADAKAEAMPSVDAMRKRSLSPAAEELMTITREAPAAKKVSVEGSREICSVSAKWKLKTHAEEGTIDLE